LNGVPIQSSHRPLREDDLWIGYPERPTSVWPREENDVSAGAVIGAVWVRDLSAACNLAVRDNFNLQSSHVIPALIRKAMEACERGDQELPVWGDGSPTREFLYVEDAADGIVTAAEKYNGDQPVNLGSGYEISIRDLAEMIVRMTGFEGKLVWQTDKPNGQPRRGLEFAREGILRLERPGSVRGRHAPDYRVVQRESRQNSLINYQLQITRSVIGNS
jgi:GDP-L-fucose synthase